MPKPPPTRFALITRMTTMTAKTKNYASETAGFIGCCFAALVFAYAVAGMIQ